MQQPVKWKLMLCVESVRVLSLVELIIVVYAIDASLGWIIIVRKYIILCICMHALYLLSNQRLYNDPLGG